MSPDYKSVASGELFRDQFESNGWEKQRKRAFSFHKQVGDIIIILGVNYSRLGHQEGRFGGYPIVRAESKKWATLGSVISDRLKNGIVAIVATTTPGYHAFFGEENGRKNYPIGLLSPSGEYRGSLIDQLMARCETFGKTFDPKEYLKDNIDALILPEMQEVVAGIFGLLLSEERISDVDKSYRLLGDSVESTSDSIPDNQWDLLNAVLHKYKVAPSWSL
jgi:hypothetical protein